MTRQEILNELFYDNWDEVISGFIWRTPEEVYEHIIYEGFSGRQAHKLASAIIRELGIAES